MMNRRNPINALLCAWLAWFPLSADAGNPNLVVSSIPRLKHHTAAVDASLRALHGRILKEAKSCEALGEATDSTGQYHAVIKKTIETPSIVGLEVAADYICSGVHSGVYQYGIAYRIKDGKRFDLNEVYALGRREEGHLHLTEKSAVPVLAHLKRMDADMPDCLQTLSDDYLTGQPFTPAVLPDGTIRLYFDVPYVVAACFDTVELSPQEVDVFKDKKKAVQYGLP